MARDDDRDGDDKKAHRSIAPSKRVTSISSRPSRTEAANPIADYLTKASDTMGRSVHLSFSMSPEVRRIASILMAKQRFPFETEPDIWRWCVKHGLAELGRRAEDKEATGEIRRMNALMRTARHELESAYYEKVFDGLRRTVRVLLEKGHLIKAEQMADEIWKSHDAVEDPYWRKEFRGMAKTLLDEVRAARDDG